MKVLRANIYYILPDDFEGDFDAALHQWIAYKNAPRADPPANLSRSVSHEALFLNSRYGFVTTADIGVWHLERATWKRLDPEESPFIA